MTVTSSEDSPKFHRASDGTGSYHKVSDRKIAYSIPLSDLVIADYDDSGAVRGVEFVGKQTEPITISLEKARKLSEGPSKPRGPIPGV